MLTKCDPCVNGCANNRDIVNVVTSQTENDEVVDVNSINCWTAARSGLGHLIRSTRKDKMPKLEQSSGSMLQLLCL